MKDILLIELLKKHREGTATSEESIILQSWYLHESKRRGEGITKVQLETANDEIWERIIQNTSVVNKPELRAKKLWYKVGAAAVMLLILFAGLFFYFDSFKEKEELIVPGENQATLTLGERRIIVLNNAAKGQIAEQDGAAISKTSGGTIIYKESETASIPRYHTIKTPKGGQYNVVLPDGSKVWLNAASSLKYPSSFADLRNRTVILTGEAYFEVKKMRKPFKVITRGQEVTVLGTKFNINGYGDEPTIRTTLEEGLLRVVALKSENKGKKQATVTLKAGQQSEVSNYTITINKNIIVENELAWRAGEFRFNNLGIKGFMRTVSRWYDVDVYYKGPIPDISYGGSISRNTKFMTLIQMMEYIGYVKFEVKGRRVTVSRPPDNPNNSINK